MSLSEVLSKGREKYAADPSHAPYGQFTSRCPATCLDWAGDPHNAAVAALARAANLRSADGWREGLGARIAVIIWNAETSTEEVLEAWDRAIEAAKEGERS